MIRVTQEHRVIQEEPKELRVFKELKELLEMAHRVLLVLREPTEITATMVPTGLKAQRALRVKMAQAIQALKGPPVLKGKMVQAIQVLRGPQEPTVSMAIRGLPALRDKMVQVIQAPKALLVTMDQMVLLALRARLVLRVLLADKVAQAIQALKVLQESTETPGIMVLKATPAPVA